MDQQNCLFIEASVRRRLSLPAEAFNPAGMYPLQDFPEARKLAEKVNRNRKGTDAVPASELYLISLLLQAGRELIESYLVKLNSGTGGSLSLSDMIARRPQEEWNRYLSDLERLFPGSRSIPDEDPLDSLRKQNLLEERLTDAVLLKLLNLNPACSRSSFLFPDNGLPDPPGETLLDDLNRLFEGTGIPSGWKAGLVDLLTEPARLFPDSLEQQIRFILKNWENRLNLSQDTFLLALDFFREDHKPGLTGPGPVEGIDFTCMDDDTARFSSDSDWMPNVILLAKNAYVWLDQLTRQYGYPVCTLGDIPEEELNELQNRGITGLWLIGLWERSESSRTIKRICGNPEAEASAYSLKNYEIADVLGGWQALEDLRNRCIDRGIRLASDMVPNHSGLDSDWVLSHPSYFQTRTSLPYPGYDFNGPDLSPDSRVGLFIENGYYNKTDAAVVFKRVDNDTGEELFIYHGNDGTSMPWNDTAQIDFLNPEAREEVIRQILHVARNFPIIRFDAAMTLARKHIQRLWFPKPGDGGAVPSRSEYSLSDEEFRKLMPEEFWREVVNRIAQEAPDTLLLAEAFWMMEGYFVRNLGMHRVYNSAFMNLLKTEDNGEFRRILKETLEYDPKILKRFVNFMNNPDEDTAVAQFGKGDKYFGICTLMMTLPGLPMVGHGQFEGFEEKYGMEYRKAYRDEQPDHDLMERHRREIVPLMKRRSLFAGARKFHLFDFETSAGRVNENVYAFANSRDGRSAVVFYNNCNTATEGIIRNDVPKAVNNHSGENQGHRTASLHEILNLHPRQYTLLFDIKEKLWYLHRNSDLIRNGLPVQLQGYQSRVFYPVEQREDDQNRSLERLLRKIGGSGVPDLDRAMKHAELEPVIHMLRTFLQNRLIDTPVMSDLITMLSADMNRIRRLLALQGKKRPDRKNTRSRKRMESIILPAIQSLMLSEPDDNRLFQMARFYEYHRIWLKSAEPKDYRELFIRLLSDPDYRDCFGINSYRDVLWFNKEYMEEAVWWFSVVGALTFLGPRTDSAFLKSMNDFEEVLTDLQNALAESEYQIRLVIDGLRSRQTDTGNTYC